MVWFWYFVIYSFLGFCIEVVFARLTHQKKRDRKCLYLLPLCPVYGFGAVAILLLPPPIRENGLLLFFMGGLTATVVEYLTGVWDRRVLGVKFWDYTGLPGSTDGVVCLPFGLVWGLLAILLVRLLHPWVERRVTAIPHWVTVAALVLVLGDGVSSAFRLRKTGTTDSLKWYSQPS